MRNLKKLLCLVLAVAMMASMFVVGASAAEKVYSETTKYSEAAAVITADAVKVMDGYEDGTMRYDAPVTREQAATIICKILLGTTAAENLKTGTAPFADVPATRWSAGYIAYLKSKGIVSGVTDTTFNPTAGVTGVQFAKMLLSAVGYGANKEFDGAAWDINTISQANASGLFETTKAADLTAGATREECMLYAFNTMTKVPTVKYNKTFDSYYVGPSALQSVTGEVDASDATTPYQYTLAYTNFKLLKSGAQVGGDAFGRPSTDWKIGNAIIAENVASATPVATLNGAVSSATLYNALGKSVVNAINNAVTVNGSIVPTKYADYITVKIDGIAAKTKKENPGDANETVDFTWAPILEGRLTTNAMAGAGAVTEIYVDNSGDVPKVTIVIYYEHFDEVTRVIGGSNPGLKLKSGATVYAKDVNTAGYAVGDKLLYTTGKDGIVSLEKIGNPVSGEVTAKSSMGAYTIGGKPYSINKKASVSIEVKKSYEVYLDSYGNIVGAEEQEDSAGVSNNFVYVTAAEQQPYTGSVLNGAEAKVALTVVYPEGGKEVVYYALKYDKKYADDKAKGYGYYISNPDSTATGDSKNLWIADTTAVIDQGWYTYTKNSSGEITLRKIAVDAKNIGTLNQVTIQKDRYFGASVNANSKTVLNIIKNDGTVASYTGIANFPSKDAAGQKNWATVYTFSGSDALVINVYSGTQGVPNTIEELAYVTYDAGEVTEGHSLKVNIDGKVIDIVLDDVEYAKVSTGILDPAAGKVLLLSEADGIYTVDEVKAAYASGNGLVNAGLKTDYTGFDVGTEDKAVAPEDGKLPVNYGVMDFTTFATNNYEHAIVASVDNSYFSTVEVKAGETEGSAAGIVEPRYTYDYDKDTKIVDITGQGATTIEPGDVFVAYINNNAQTLDGHYYCSYIWIVG